MVDREHTCLLKNEKLNRKKKKISWTLRITIPHRIALVAITKVEDNGHAQTVDGTQCRMT